MVQTVKFSQFVQGGNMVAGNKPVGLNELPGGTNTIWNFAGGGSGGGQGVTYTITQTTPLSLGNWVRVNASGVYVGAQGDDAQDAEVIGIVIATPATGLGPDQYTIQQSGYITTAMGIFTGLTTGSVYFLSTSSSGTYMATDASVNGQVSRPIFVADSPTSGWVLPYRGLIVGGIVPTQGGGGGGTSPEIQIINQNGNGFSIGQWVRVANPSVSLVQPVYVLALADSLAQDAQSVGVVTATGLNQFTIQFAGYNEGAVSTDDLGNPLLPATVYYLSPRVAGAVTAVNPTLANQISKPLFICEQTASGPLSTGINTGWILPQRPLDLNLVNNDVRTVSQANTFGPGNWVYIQSDSTYALALATNLATSQVAGVVISQPNVNNFTVQQAGWNTGAVTVDDAGAPLVSGAVYYLSSTVAGAIHNGPPSTMGYVSKPCYVQEVAASFTGEILPQRPLIVGSIIPPTPPPPAIQVDLEYNGATQSIISSLNVSSVTYNAAGQYTINFVLPLANGNYYAICTGGRGATDTLHWWAHGPISANPSTTSFRFGAGTFSVYMDLQYVYCQIWA